MWTPVKLKPNPKARGWKPQAGWYCYDSESLSSDLRSRHSGKQAAQKECNRRNGVEEAKAGDGKTRNVKKWFTVGYVDRMGSLIEDQLVINPTTYHGYLSELLRQTLETVQGGYVPGAVVAVIWPEQISRHTALYGQHAHPIHHVFADGRITGSTS